MIYGVTLMALAPTFFTFMHQTPLLLWYLSDMTTLDPALKPALTAVSPEAQYVRPIY